MNFILDNKYLCKRSLVFWDDINSIIQKDKYYKVVKIGINHVIIHSTPVNDESNPYIYGNLCYEALSITIGHDVSPWYFFDYFYTEKEIRKQKLEKLM